MRCASTPGWMRRVERAAPGQPRPRAPAKTAVRLLFEMGNCFRGTVSERSERPWPCARGTEQHTSLGAHVLRRRDLLLDRSLPRTTPGPAPAIACTWRIF